MKFTADIRVENGLKGALVLIQIEQRMQLEAAPDFVTRLRQCISSAPGTFPPGNLADVGAEGLKAVAASTEGARGLETASGAPTQEEAPAPSPEPEAAAEGAAVTRTWSRKPVSDEELRRTVWAWRTFGHPAAAGAELGIKRNAVLHRIQLAKKRGLLDEPGTLPRRRGGNRIPLTREQLMQALELAATTEDQASAAARAGCTLGAFKQRLRRARLAGLSAPLAESPPQAVAAPPAPAPPPSTATPPAPAPPPSTATPAATTPPPVEGPHRRKRSNGRGLGHWPAPTKPPTPLRRVAAKPPAPRRPVDLGEVQKRLTTRPEPAAPRAAVATTAPMNGDRADTWLGLLSHRETATWIPTSNLVARLRRLGWSTTLSPADALTHVLERIGAKWGDAAVVKPDAIYFLETRGRKPPVASPAPGTDADDVG